MKLRALRPLPITASALGSLVALPLSAAPDTPWKSHLDAILERPTPPTPGEINTLDRNHDGQIDVRDLVVFLNDLREGGPIRFALTTSHAVAEGLIVSQAQAASQQDGQVLIKFHAIAGPGLLSSNSSQPIPTSPSGIRLTEATLVPTMAAPLSQ